MSEHWTADQEKSPIQCPAAAVVSLNKELYSHCSSPPSCINGGLAIAGEADAIQSMSHLINNSII